MGSMSIYYCSELESIDLPKARQLSSYCLYSCSKLSTVILRNTTVCTIASNVLRSTPIASGTGYVYVPDNLVDSYKTATNWSQYAAQIKGISELPTN